MDPTQVVFDPAALVAQEQAAFDQLMANAQAWAKQHSLVLDLPPGAGALQVMQWLAGAGYTGSNDGQSTLEQVVFDPAALSVQMQVAFDRLMADAQDWAKRHSLVLDLPPGASAIQIMQWLAGAGYTGTSGPATLTG